MSLSTLYGTETKPEERILFYKLLWNNDMNDFACFAYESRGCFRQIYRSKLAMQFDHRQLVKKLNNLLKND